MSLDRRYSGGPLLAWFYDPIYNANFYLFRSTFAAFLEDGKKRWPFGRWDGVEPGGKAMCIEDGKGKRYYVIWAPPTMRGTAIEDIATLAHEVYHVVSYVLLERGMAPRFNDDEAFAYYHGWLLAQCLKHYRAPKRSKKGKRHEGSEGAARKDRQDGPGRDREDQDARGQTAPRREDEDSGHENVHEVLVAR